MGIEGERRVAFEGNHERDDILTHIKIDPALAAWVCGRARP